MFMLYSCCSKRESLYIYIAYFEKSLQSIDNTAFLCTLSGLMFSGNRAYVVILTVSCGENSYPGSRCPVCFYTYSLVPVTVGRVVE